MNYTDAQEACESFGGRLAVPGSFSEEEKLDAMQCIPPNVVFWTDQKGPKDGSYTRATVYYDSQVTDLENHEKLKMILYVHMCYETDINIEL